MKLIVISNETKIKLQAALEAGTLGVLSQQAHGEIIRAESFK